MQPHNHGSPGLGKRPNVVPRFTQRDSKVAINELRDLALLAPREQYKVLTALVGLG